MDADTISKRYIEECKKDMEGLNVKPSGHEESAYRGNLRMLDMIGSLIESRPCLRGGRRNRFISVQKSFEAMESCPIRISEDLQSGFREIKVTGEEAKRIPTDFVLWKPKKGSPSGSPPGARAVPAGILSARSWLRRYLGDEIDIHAGGEDLIFPTMKMRSLRVRRPTV